MQQRMHARLRALLKRLGLAANILQHDSCTIQVDALPVHLVARADRWALLYCELGALPDTPDALLLSRLLSANLRPAEGPAYVLALDAGTRSVMLRCQVDLAAHDDGEWFERFEDFIVQAERAQAWFARGCVSAGAHAPGVASSAKRYAESQDKLDLAAL